MKAYIESSSIPALKSNNMEKKVFTFSSKLLKYTECAYFFTLQKACMFIRKKHKKSIKLNISSLCCNFIFGHMVFDLDIFYAYFLSIDISISHYELFVNHFKVLISILFCLTFPCSKLVEIGYLNLF